MSDGRDKREALRRRLERRRAANKAEAASRRKALKGRHAELREELAERKRKAATTEEPRRRRWWLLLPLLLLLLFLLKDCRCAEPAPPAAIAPIAPALGEPALPEPPAPAPSPSPTRVQRIDRPELQTLAPSSPPWLDAFRLQVAARSPRLAACFVDAERPGRLKWTASVEPSTGQVSGHTLEPMLQGAELSRTQRTCVVEALSAPSYALDDDDRSTPSKVGLVIEF